MVGGIDCGKLLPCSDRWILYETDVPKHQLSGIYLRMQQRPRAYHRVYFVDHLPDAGSYRGELLGLMAIHLVLRGVHEFSPAIRGSVQIISDCMGALNKVENMPPYQIPTKCSHPDILKNIMINCEGLSFKRMFSHVAAHQDDRKDYGELSRESQLNCQMDFYAKQAILGETNGQYTTTKRFPL
jgi:hypothetical protein